MNLFTAINNALQITLQTDPKAGTRICLPLQSCEISRSCVW